MKEPEGFVKARYGAWVFGFIFLLVFLPLMFYAPTASNYIYSYLLQPNPGTLYSERWSYNFFVTGSIILLIVAPITMWYSVSFPRSKSIRIVHIVIVVILIVWYLIGFIIGCVNWASANEGTVSNFFNKANDARWCCVYYMLPGSPCPQVPCNPTYMASQLTTDALFLFQLWYTFVLWIALLVDIVFFMAYVRLGLEEFDDYYVDTLKDVESDVNLLLPVATKSRPKAYRSKNTY